MEHMCVESSWLFCMFQTLPTIYELAHSTSSQCPCKWPHNHLYPIYCIQMEKPTRPHSQNIAPMLLHVSSRAGALFCLKEIGRLFTFHSPCSPYALCLLTPTKLLSSLPPHTRQTNKMQLTVVSTPTQHYKH